MEYSAMTSESQIVEFLKSCLGELLQMEAFNVAVDRPLDSHYGLSSMDLLTLGGRLEDRLSIALDPDIMFSNRTVLELAKAAAQIQKAG